MWAYKRYCLFVSHKKAPHKNALSDINIERRTLLWQTRLSFAKIVVKNLSSPSPSKHSTKKKALTMTPSDAPLAEKSANNKRTPMVTAERTINF